MKAAAWCVAALVVVATPALAQNHFALEIITPAPVDTAANGGLDADNRVFWAYPGLEYRIRAEARGGRYPYTYSLSGAPAGMAIEAGPCTVIGPTCTAGTITWTPADASSDDASITVQVCDADNDCTSKSWGIDVVDPATQTRFRFIDATNGSATVTNGGTGTGTAANPWLTLEDAYEDSGANSICYFRTGTYTPGGLAPTYTENDDHFGGEERVTWNSGSRCTIWLEYPGDTAVIDFEYTGNGCGTSPATYDCGQSVPRYRMEGEVTYISGFSVTRVMVIAFHLARNSRYGAAVHRNAFTVAGPGRDGVNAAFLSYIQTYGGGGTPDTQVIGDIITNNTFDNSGGQSPGPDALKAYSWLRGIIADNSFTDFSAGTTTVEAVALKADVSDVTVRSNIFTDATIGGNNDTHNVGEETGGEIYHNVFIGDATQYLGESRVDCCIGEFFIYRNTFIGPAIQLQNLTEPDGPITYTQNVIVNAQAAVGSCPAKFFCTPGGGDDVVDYTTFSLSNNLTGVAADNITDANGELQGTYLTDHGPDSATPKGHMLDDGGAVPATVYRFRFRVAADLGRWLAELRTAA